jgi:hypothetical protein
VERGVEKLTAGGVVGLEQHKRVRFLWAANANNFAVNANPEILKEPLNCKIVSFLLDSFQHDTGRIT